MATTSDLPQWMTATPEGVRLALLVQPRASRSRIAGEHDGRLKVTLAAPPVEGAANDALLRFFAKHLRVARGDLTLAQGARGRRKMLVVQGLSPAEIAERLRLNPNTRKGS